MKLFDAITAVSQDVDFMADFTNWMIFSFVVLIGVLYLLAKWSEKSKVLETEGYQDPTLIHVSEPRKIVRAQDNGDDVIRSKMMEQMRSENPVGFAPPVDCHNGIGAEL